MARQPLTILGGDTSDRSRRLPRGERASGRRRRGVRRPSRRPRPPRNPQQRRRHILNMSDMQDLAELHASEIVPKDAPDGVRRRVVEAFTEDLDTPRSKFDEEGRSRSDDERIRLARAAQATRLKLLTDAPPPGSDPCGDHINPNKLDAIAQTHASEVVRKPPPGAYDRHFHLREEAAQQFIELYLSKTHFKKNGNRIPLGERIIEARHELVRWLEKEKEYSNSAVLYGATEKPKDTKDDEHSEEPWTIGAFGEDEAERREADSFDPDEGTGKAPENEAPYRADRRFAPGETDEVEYEEVLPDETRPAEPKLDAYIFHMFRKSPGAPGAQKERGVEWAFEVAAKPHPDRHRLRAFVRQLIQALTDTEHRILKARVINELPFTEIGEELGLNRRKVSAIYRSVIARLRRRAREWEKGAA